MSELLRAEREQYESREVAERYIDTRRTPTAPASNPIRWRNGSPMLSTGTNSTAAAPVMLTSSHYYLY